MTDVSERVATLTDAKRRIFMDATEIGCIVRNGSTRSSLIAQGYAVQSAHPDRQALDWTPLGLQVYHLLRETNNA